MARETGDKVRWQEMRLKKAMHREAAKLTGERHDRVLRLVP